MKTAQRFYTTETLGPKQRVTPEGFLVCLDVPIARIGEMEYSAEEILDDVTKKPLFKGNADGIVMVERNADDVFREETIASFEGKPVTDNHPQDEFVSPENWREYVVGHVTNVRRGTDAEKDFLFADLVVWSPEVIADIQAGKREVSCGYNADYEKFTEERGAQKNIVGNHVALVDAGRCGPRCAIGDHDPNRKKEKKVKTTWKDLKDRILKHAKAKDCDAIAKELEEAPIEDEGASGGGSSQHIHVHLNGSAPAGAQGGGGAASATGAEDEGSAGGGAAEPTLSDVIKRIDAIDARVTELSGKVGGAGVADDAEEKEKKEKEDREKAEAADKATKDAAAAKDAEEIEKELKEEAPEGEGEKAAKAKDSAFMQDSFNETVALAEVISPGITIPTYDRAAAPKATYDALCGLRRQALTKGLEDAATAAIVVESRGRKTTADDIAKLTCDSVRTLFRATGVAKKRANNKSAFDTKNAAASKNPLKTNADLNKFYTDYYSKQ